MDTYGYEMKAFHPAISIIERLPLWDQAGYDALTIRAFGAPVMHLGGVPLVFGRRKSAALLIYLAVTRSAHSRDALANLLWGDLPQLRAAANLRKVLAELRDRVGGAVDMTRHTIAVNPDYPIMLDVAAFEVSVDHGIASAAPQLITRAIRGYPDDFLAGYCLPSADAFDEWALLYREQLRDRLIAALEALATIHIRRGEYRAALGPTRRVVALDPWREEGHRQLMWLLARSGDRAAAVAQYEACRQTLSAELGIEPSAETVSLYQQLTADTDLPHSSARTDTTSAGALDDDRDAPVWARRNVYRRVRTYTHRRPLQRCPTLSLMSQSFTGKLPCTACLGGDVRVGDRHRAS